MNLHYKVTYKVLTTDFHLLELIIVKSNLSEIYSVQKTSTKLFNISENMQEKHSPKVLF